MLAEQIEVSQPAFLCWTRWAGGIGYCGTCTTVLHCARFRERSDAYLCVFGHDGQKGGCTVHDIEESRAIEVIRDFFASPAAARRPVTAEWLAGRLGLPVSICEAALARLVAAKLLRRVNRGKALPVYVPYEGRRRYLGGQLLVAVIALAIAVGAAFIAINSRYVFIAIEALAVGLIVAFAWLDAELHDTRPPGPLR